MKAKKFIMAPAMKGPELPRYFFRQSLEITWLATIFLIPLFFNPESNQVFVLNKAALLQFLVIAMLAFWVADWLSDQASQKKLTWHFMSANPLHVSILVFGLITAVATVISIMPAISFWGSYYRKAGLINILCWIVFFLILAQGIKSRAQLLRIIYVLLSSSAVVSIVGILQYFFPAFFSVLFNWPYNGRVFSTVGNPLFLSSFLSMVIPFNLAMIIYGWSHRRKGYNVKLQVGMMVLLALQFWCLWLAQYSITVLLYIISSVFFLLLWGIVKRRKLLLGLGAGALLALMIVAGMLLVPLLLPANNNVNTGNGQNVATEPTTSEGIGLESLGWRVQYWRSTVELLRHTPEIPFSNDKLHCLRKLIGYGPETFIATFQQVFPEELKSDYTYRSLLVDRPHNDYLYLAATVGFLGLMSFLAVLGVFFYLCYRYLRKARADIDKLLLVAMVAAVVQYMADIFFNPSNICPELVLWLSVSFVPIVGRLITKPKSENNDAEDDNHKIKPKSDAYRIRRYLSIVCAGLFVILGIGITIRPVLADLYLRKAVDLQTIHIGQAITSFEKATQIDPQEATYWHFLGEYSFSVGRNLTDESLKDEAFSLSTKAYNRAVQLTPYIALERYSMADVYAYLAALRNADNWPQALSSYDAASQLFPDNAFILGKWALASIVKGDLEDADNKLETAASADPEWAQTSFLSGLVLGLEGKDEAAARTITAPVRDNPLNLSYYVDWCNTLQRYYTLEPLRNLLASYTVRETGDWVGHALLGVTDLFLGDINSSVIEFDASMKTVTAVDVGPLFLTVMDLSNLSPSLKTALSAVAGDWKDKLNQSPDRDSLLPILEQLPSGTK